MTIRLHAFWLAMALALPAAASTRSQVDDDDANAPYRTYDSTPAIVMGPLLLDMAATSVVVEWITDMPSDGSLTYGEQGTEHRVVPQQDGLTPVGTLHRVVIDGLLPGHAYRYKVASRRVLAVKPYWPDRGRGVESDMHAFTTFDSSRPSTRFAVITDTHEDVARTKALLAMADAGGVDFIVHDGDGVNYATSENQLREKFLEPMATGLKSQVPLLFIRGNHEYRGEFARSLGDYLHAQEGRYFYTRDDGPVHLVAIDTGKDKPDTTNVYAGLNDVRDYREGEFTWLRDTLKRKRK